MTSVFELPLALAGPKGGGGLCPGFGRIGPGKGARHCSRLGRGLRPAGAGGRAPPAPGSHGGVLPAPGAGMKGGQGGLKAGWDQAAAAFHGASFAAGLDGAAAPGAALAALRAGFKFVIFDLGHPAAASVLGAAQEAGAEIWGTRPEALDLGALDPRQRDDERRISALFATVPPQDQPR